MIRLPPPPPVDTGRKLNVHKTFRRRLLNVLCLFSLRPVSTGPLLEFNRTRVFVMIPHRNVQTWVREVDM